MKRKLPPLTGKSHYPGSETSKLFTLADPTGFALWALFERNAEALLVRVVRAKTHEVPGSKWVSFQFAPAGVLLNGRPFYAKPEFADALIRCEWSDFLRLTRWRKEVTDCTPLDQARLARVWDAPMKPGMLDTTFLLQSVDDPIRKRKG